MAKKPSRRQTIRERRLQRQRRQRLTTILIIAAIAVVVAGLLIYPSIRNSLTPVGEFVRITPDERPLVDGRALGAPNAPVLVEVFEDFQCPACRTFSEEVEPLIVENYVAAGQVRYVFRHYPFIDDRAAGNESDQSANASMCAAEQERFWDYHDMLFANWNGENAGAFRDRRLIAFAEALELDMDQFQACFDENRYQEEINSDRVEGDRMGVTGTPSVFVDGEIVAPGFVPTYQQIQQVVDASLASSQ